MLALEMAAFWLSGQWIGAGSGIVAVVSGAAIQPPGRPQYKSWNVNAADGDTLLVVTHGFVDANGAAIAPDRVEIQSITSGANAARPNWGVTVNSTQIILSKQSPAGSGGTPAAKLWAYQPHTILQ